MKVRKKLLTVEISSYVKNNEAMKFARFERRDVFSPAKIMLFLTEQMKFVLAGSFPCQGVEHLRRPIVALHRAFENEFSKLGYGLTGFG